MYETVIGKTITCTDDELINIGLGLADSSFDESELIDWIILHS